MSWISENLYPAVVSTMMLSSASMAAQLGPMQIFSMQGDPFSSHLTFSASSDEVSAVQLEIVDIECTPPSDECPALSIGTDNLSDPASPDLFIRRIVSIKPVIPRVFDVRIRLTSPRQVLVRSYKIELDTPLPRLDRRRLGAHNLMHSSPPPVVTRVETERAIEHADTEKVIFDLIQNWADAWSRKDVEKYLSFYAEFFEPKGGVSRSVWAASRKDRIFAPSEIQVDIENLRTIAKSSSQMVVQFLQDYKATHGERKLRMRATKQLFFDRVGQDWKISREEVLSSQ